MSKQTNLQTMAPKKNIGSLPNHMNLHILHHTTSKKTYGLDQASDLTKARSNAFKHTSLNTTVKITWK